MENPFSIIERRLNRIESLLLESQKPDIHPPSSVKAGVDTIPQQELNTPNPTDPGKGKRQKEASRG